MSTIQQDFDRIALATLASEDGAAHNDHYHNFLLRHLPPRCHDVLEVGCGTGAFARRLAEHCEAGSAGKRGPRRGSLARECLDSVIVFPMAPRVLALDLSPEMIRLARERSAQFPNIEYQLADVRDLPLPVASFDCIATIATLHHLPLAEVLLKLKTALKPGGVLLVLDLFEPARWSDLPLARLSDSPITGLSKSLIAALSDSLLNLLAVPVSVGLRLKHYGRLRQRPEVRAAWAAHEHHDLYPTMREVRDLCASLLPGAKIKQHLLWRYSIVWKKPG